MEYRVTVTKSGSITAYKQSQYEYALMYMQSLLEQKIAFSFEFA